jgi:hypothetical protein
MAMSATFALRPRLSLSLRHLGREREPMLVIDRLMVDPGALVDMAARQVFSPVHGPAGGYPGVRAPAPLDLVQAVVRALTDPIGEAFGLGTVKPVRAECNLSLVTLAPAALVPSQRAPHIDTVDPWQFAILHYLCPSEFGGTGFFRHRATGYETLSAERLPTFDAARETEAADPGYVADGGRWFESTGEVEAAFDRVAVYRSCLLHSGRILASDRLSADPRQGRLTANIFVTFRPVA